MKQKKNCNFRLSNGIKRILGACRSASTSNLIRMSSMANYVQPGNTVATTSNDVIPMTDRTFYVDLDQL